jgi:class 3 adenylate cyclase
MAAMTESAGGRLPAAAYIEFATPLADGVPAETLTRVLRANPTLPPAEMTLPVGAGLLFNFSHPTQTLAFAREMIALASEDRWRLPPLRIGLHVSAISREAAENQENTLSGGSIDGAMRLASLAQPNQALASAQFQTVVLHLLKLGSGLLAPLGKRTTAGGKSVEVFEVTPAAQSAKPGARRAREEGLTESALAALELALANEIGQTAKTVVKQASAHLPDQNRFLLHLADAVPDAERRRTFLAKATKLT